MYESIINYILTNGGIVGLAQKAFNKVKRYGSEAVGWLKSEIKFIRRKDRDAKRSRTLDITKSSLT